MKPADFLPPAAQKHYSEFARAAAAAMHLSYQETIDICSDLLTSGIYPELLALDATLARRLIAETRLMMAAAMHYNDAHYEDIVRVLNSALDSPDEVRKDALFTLAVVHLSFEKPEAARQSMQQCLELISELCRQGADDGSLLQQEQEAAQFLSGLAGIEGS